MSKNCEVTNANKTDQLVIFFSVIYVSFSFLWSPIFLIVTGRQNFLYNSLSVIYKSAWCCVYRVKHIFHRRVDRISNRRAGPRFSRRDMIWIYCIFFIFLFLSRVNSPHKYLLVVFKEKRTRDSASISTFFQAVIS